MCEKPVRLSIDQYPDLERLLSLVLENRVSRVSEMLRAVGVKETAAYNFRNA